MSKKHPQPVDPLHQDANTGIDTDDAQIEQPKDDAFKKPPETVKPSNQPAKKVGRK